MEKKSAIMTVLVMMLTIPIQAVTADTVNVEAQVTSFGTPPAIEYMFVLSDDDLIEDGTQILPHPGNGNDEVMTYFKKYVVVSDPNGVSDIAAVFEKLKDPSGIQIGSEGINTDITNTAEKFDALNEAISSGLITQAEYDDMIYKLDPSKKQARMFVIENCLNNHDEPGNYTVIFKAVDNAGGWIEASTIFEYLTLKSLELDFNIVDYGQIIIGTEKWVAGDETFDPSGNSTVPTTKNQGNIPLQIEVSATNLTGIFDSVQPIPASVLCIELLGQHFNGLQIPVVFNGELQPCTPTQMSFGITAPFGTSANTYQGQINICIA